MMPNVSFVSDKNDLHVIQQYDNFTKQHKDFILNHITFQMNDFNPASIRVTKLREIIRDYEPNTFVTINQMNDLNTANIRITKLREMIRVMNLILL